MGGFQKAGAGLAVVLASAAYYVAYYRLYTMRRGFIYAHPLNPDTGINRQRRRRVALFACAAFPWLAIRSLFCDCTLLSGGCRRPDGDLVTFPDVSKPPGGKPLGNFSGGDDVGNRGGAYRSNPARFLQGEEGPAADDHRLHRRAHDWRFDRIVVDRGRHRPALPIAWAPRIAVGRTAVCVRDVHPVSRAFAEVRISGADAPPPGDCR